MLAYLFGDSQLESEAEETKEAIERIMEEAETQEPLKTKRTPLVAALKAIGLDDVDDQIEYDPEGFAIKCEEESQYRLYVRLLMEPDSMEKLAELGWVVTRCGDVAMNNEPPEFRIRFLEIHFVNNDEQSPDQGSWPPGDSDGLNDILKKGREFMSTPMDRDHDDLNPVEHPDQSKKKNAGVGDAKDGAKPEGKPKTGKSKTESLLESPEGSVDGSDYGDDDQAPEVDPDEDRTKRKKVQAEDLVNELLDVNEAGHKAGCQCGFCKNKGSLGKKKKDDSGDDSSEESSDDMAEGESRKCPVCQSTDTVKGEETGKKIRCLNCGNEFLPVSEAEQRTVPYIGKDKKQRMVPYVSRSKKKMGESKKRR